jgi:hypothetical protein
MKENFPYWTSENKVIDKLIRYTQLNASQTCDYLEWFPFETFEMVRYIGSGGFGSVYSAFLHFVWRDKGGIVMMVRKNGLELDLLHHIFFYGKWFSR